MRKFLPVITLLLLLCVAMLNGQVWRSGSRVNDKSRFSKPMPVSKFVDKGVKRAPESDKRGQVAKFVAPVDTSMMVVNPGEEFSQVVLKRFYNLYAKGIQEKLYLQCDKPYYCVGDSIWIRGSVINAITHVPINFSKYIYVELRDELDSLRSRIKIKSDSTGLFASRIELAPELPQGNYTLVAYTKWMTNSDSELFFRRPIRIANPIDDSFNVSVSYTEDPKMGLMAIAKLTNFAGDPLPNMRVECAITIDQRTRGSVFRSDGQGNTIIPITRPTKEGLDNYISLSANNEKVKGMKVIHLPIFEQDFDLQFFPEGGNLVDGVAQNVAFKAVAANGLGGDVSLVVFNSSGQEVGRSTSTHKGMGRFTVLPSVDDALYVEASMGERKKRFNLPPVQPSGCVLQVQQIKGNIVYRVDMSHGLDPSRFGVVLQSSGRIISAAMLSKDRLTRVISRDFVPSGVSQLTVIDSLTMSPVAERLFFVYPTKLPKVAFSADKTRYGARSKVVLDVDVVDGAGGAVEGNFAMSVTDASTVQPDSMGLNILSYTLLSSDLRGYIEEPSSYFIGDSYTTAMNLDLLMMTQGWRRFDIDNMLKGNLPSIKHPHEASQVISGEVKGFFGNAAKRPQILVISPQLGITDIVQLNQGNRFNLVGLDFPDSTKFIIQAMGRSGSGRFVTLNIDEPKFPVVNSLKIKPMVGSVERFLPQAFIDQSQKRYYYAGGMRVIDMEAVSVTAQRAKSNNTRLFDVTPTRSIGPEVLERYPGASIYNLLQMMPGVRVLNGTDISIRNSNDPPMIFIDQMQVESEFLNGLSTADIAAIDMIVGPEASIYGLGASGGVILINLKDGSEVTKSMVTSPSLASVSQLGYKKPVEFYQPRYDLPHVKGDKRPDLRSTLLWAPSVATDARGRARVEFYTGDNPVDYNVVLEGYSPSGEIVRGVTTLKR